MILRFSALQLLLDCPLRFYKRYILGIEEPPSMVTDQGHVVHNVLENWHKDPFLDIENACRKEVLKYDTLEPEFDRILEECIIMARVFVKRFELDFATVHTEKRLKVQFGEGGHIITGKPDYFAIYPDTGRARLVDYKTGRLKPKTMQLRVYAWMGSLHYGFRNCRTELWYLRDGDVVVEELGPEDFEEAKLWVMDRFAEIDERLTQGEAGFPPRSNRFCQYCPHAITCPAAEPPEKMLKEKTDEELVAECLALEARYKTLQKEIKARVSKNGPIIANGVVFDFHPSAPGKTVTDMELYYELLKRNDLSMDGYLKADATAIKKLLKDEKLAKQFQQVITSTVPRKTFKWKPVENVKNKEQQKESA